jgi:hypothetical protein
VSRAPKRASDEPINPGPRTRTRVRFPELGSERVELLTAVNGCGPAATAMTAVAAAGEAVAVIVGAAATAIVGWGAGAAATLGAAMKRFDGGALATVGGAAAAVLII